MYQDNDPKGSNIYNRVAENEKNRLASQSSDLSLTEMLWQDLKRAVQRECPQSSTNWSKVAKLKHKV